MTRREAAKVIGGTGMALLMPWKMGATSPGSEQMIMRVIPSSGEKIPVVGLGTWQKFDVDPSRSGSLAEVLRALVKFGGRVIDTSPMYGRSEQVTGQLLTQLGLRDSVFLATKVWTHGKQAGIESMERSFARLQTKTIDLMQVHNLVDVATQLATMREWKAQGRFRYLGITHYNAGAFAEVANILAREQLDFLQINYSIMEREAEEKILPLAQERGIAVIVNRPFGGGDLLQRVRGKPLPDFASEFESNSWAQFFLKWIIAHSAVTCAIPATSSIQHLEDNMGAGIGKLPDARMRQRMVEAVAKLQSPEEKNGR